MKKLILVILITVFVTIVANYVMFGKNKTSQLTNPNLKSLPSQESTPTPKPTPQVFNYTSETDLEAELDSINPQVLDSDFE